MTGWMPSPASGDGAISTLRCTNFGVSVPWGEMMVSAPCPLLATMTPVVELADPHHGQDIRPCGEACSEFDGDTHLGR
ncbi:MAG TPA: hypothetical protein VFY13_05225 [Luteolibacter sp.]|nr:hypothetical protein [Luteolibacter sp.]